MTLSLPATPVSSQVLLEFLEACGFETTTITHPPLFTVGESQELRGKIDGGHTKNLFLKDKKSNYFLLTAQEDSVVNLKTLHKLLGGTGRLSFGKPDMMLELLGVSPGAVTALGIINDREGKLSFAIDKRLLEHDKINCHPLTNEATTTIARDDLLAFAKACRHEPRIIDLDEEI
ncbi:MAG: YbaK/EbsC family protein [Rhizobiaceae bacterium]